MTPPALYRYRHERGPRGMLARWWFHRRTEQVKRRLRERIQSPRPPEERH